MVQVDTVDRILNAATILFAERGFAETSLRTITGMADVNLAAVNYHFGSKKALIQAVFSRFLIPLSQELDGRLDALEAQCQQGETPSIEELLRCLFDTLIKINYELGEDPQKFMRLLSLAYTQSQEHLRHYLVGSFGATYSRFTHLLRQALPGITHVEFYWRLYFMLGAAVFTLSSYDSIRAILNTDFNEDSSIEDAVAMMIPSLSGLLNSPNAL